MQPAQQVPRAQPRGRRGPEPQTHTPACVAPTTQSLLSHLPRDQTASRKPNLCQEESLSGFWGEKIVNVLVPFTKPQPKKITHRIPERKCAAGCPGCPAVDGSSGQAAARERRRQEQGLTTTPERWAPTPTMEAGGGGGHRPTEASREPGPRCPGRTALLLGHRRVCPGSGGAGVASGRREGAG